MLIIYETLEVHFDAVKFGLPYVIDIHKSSVSRLIADEHLSGVPIHVPKDIRFVKLLRVV